MKVKKLIIASFILFFSLFFVFPSNSVGIDDPDSTFEIGPNNYKAVYWTSLPADYLITVEVEVTAGGDEEINVYLCDSDGYYEFQNEASFTAKKTYEGISYIYFEYTTTYEDSYYLILKNPAIFIYTKTVEVKVKLEGPSSARGWSVPGSSPLLILLITLGSVGIGAIVFKRSFKKKQQNLQYLNLIQNMV